KAIDSCLLLERSVALVRGRGFEIGNIDSTIRMQRPKLRGYIDSMRERLAEVMSVELEQVSIKATTTERLGFEGLEEGVSASAIALIHFNE
ncbi:MAG: 2-C-methyl-D-erythritol 2,4-cyclodiphosphate synthase, partial [Rikenellaceae bacterium]